MITQIRFLEADPVKLGARQRDTQSSHRMRTSFNRQQLPVGGYRFRVCASIHLRFSGVPTRTEFTVLS